MQDRKSSVRRPGTLAYQALAALLICSLTGCTNIRNDRTRTQTEGALAGAALGAGAGALLGGSRNRKVGALAGAAAGGLAGAAYGTSVANRKARYASAEQELNTRLAAVRQETAQYRSYNAKLNAEVEQRKRQLAAVLAGGATQLRRVKAIQLRDALISRIRRIDRAARSWQDVIDEQKQAVGQLANERRAQELDQSVDQMVEQRDELIRQRGELMAIGEKLVE